MGKSRGNLGGKGKGPFGAMGLNKPGGSGKVRMAGQSPFGVALGEAEGPGKMKRSPFFDFINKGGGGRRGRGSMPWNRRGTASATTPASTATQDKDPNCP